jgi:prepilin-type N-terminal cleavage/methylation domain-containing protein
MATMTAAKLTGQRTLARRSGFTLIELLIVIVILGVLASITLRKFDRTRERAQFKAMMSDLRQLMVQQEAYFANPVNTFNYAGDLAVLPDYNVSSGVTVVITGASNLGWGATSGHASLDATQTCAVYYGTVTAVPTPASTPGIIACTNE